MLPSRQQSLEAADALLELPVASLGGQQQREQHPLQCPSTTPQQPSGAALHQQQWEPVEHQQQQHVQHMQPPSQAIPVQPAPPAGFHRYLEPGSSAARQLLQAPALTSAPQFAAVPILPLPLAGPSPAPHISSEHRRVAFESAGKL